MVMGTELACRSVHHGPTAWEQQQRAGGDAVMQLRKEKEKEKEKEKAMESSTKLRVVQCPKCRAYLQEPPPGNPFYECGRCFTTLQAKHATQEDVEKRLQQKALMKRMEIDKNTKSVSSEDGYKVFTSESSSEKSNDREEQHPHSGEGSPSWSPSRWESPLYGPKPGHASQQQQQQQQRQAVEGHHSQGGSSRGEALGHSLRRLAVEDNDETQYSNRTSPRSPSSEWMNAHHPGMRRSRTEELQHRNDGEGHHSQAQKMVSFNDAASRHSGELSRQSGELGRHSGEQSRYSGELGKHEPSKQSGELDRTLSFSNDLQQTSPDEAVEDSIHHLLDDFLSARYEEKPPYSKVEGYEVQRDMYAATDVAEREYGINSRTSSVGDGDTHHAVAFESQSRPLSGELDSYVVLDHRVTRPGSYQRSSSARQGSLNSSYHFSSDGQEKYHSDGERSSRTHGATSSMQQQRPASHHVQQQPHQSLPQSPPQYAYNKFPAGQNYHGSHELNSQSGATKSYPFLPRPDEAPFVSCQHCEELLRVPADLPPTKKSYQKLRCGACLKISVFLVPTEEHVAAPTVSPKGHGHFSEFSSPYASDMLNRQGSHGGRTDEERGHPHTPSVGSPRLPPMSRSIPRNPSGSKLSAMTSAANATSMVGHASVSNGVSNLYPGTGTISARSSSSSHYGDGASYRRSHSAYGPNGEHVMSSLGPRSSAGSDYEGHHPHDGRPFQTSSESDNDSPRMRPSMGSFKGEQFHASSRMPLDRNVAQQYSKDEGYMQEANMASSMSLKGIIKKGVKELTKTKQASSNNLYRRKVTVNGSPIPDELLKRAEGLAGPIHPGSYWYDPQAGFWGITGGPCLGIIPPHIDELSLQPPSRHCSGGQTGVVVNGRELHKSDYDLLVRRGLPPAPGKQYFVDIEGHVREASSGYELRGLGPLAPTLDQTSRGNGMWVPGSGQVA